MVLRPATRDCDVLRVLTANYGFFDAGAVWRPFSASMTVAGSWVSFLGATCTPVGAPVEGVFDCPAPRPAPAPSGPGRAHRLHHQQALLPLSAPGAVLDTASLPSHYVSNASPVVSALGGAAGQPTAGWGAGRLPAVKSSK